MSKGKWMDVGKYSYTPPPKFNSIGPEKLVNPERRGSSSNHHGFQGRGVKFPGSKGVDFKQ